MNSLMTAKLDWLNREQFQFISNSLKSICTAMGESVSYDAIVLPKNLGTSENKQGDD